MELRQLRYFRAVAEELSFARASRRLFIAQPALSAQVRRLEEELKVRLLERTTRSVKLTHAGSVFLAEAIDILARADAAGQHARDAERGVVGSLRVAFLSNVATAELGSRMQRFRDRFPRVNLTLLEAPTHRQVELVLRGEVDLAVLRVSRLRGQAGEVSLETDTGLGRFAAGVGLPTDELASVVIVREPMIVAVPEDSELARRRALRWRDFDCEPMIMSADPRERFFEAFLSCCERANVRPTASQYAHDLATRLWLVACGFGFTPTSAASREMVRPGLSYRALPTDGPEVFAVAAWRKADNQPHLLHFIETLKSRAAKVKRGGKQPN